MAASILARPDPRDVLVNALDLATDGLKKADTLLAALVRDPSPELAQIARDLVREHLDLLATAHEPQSSAS